MVCIYTKDVVVTVLVTLLRIPYTFALVRGGGALPPEFRNSLLGDVSCHGKCKLPERGAFAATCMTWICPCVSPPCVFSRPVAC